MTSKLLGIVAIGAAVVVYRKVTADPGGSYDPATSSSRYVA